MDFFKKAQELVKPAAAASGGDSGSAGGIAAFATSFVSSHTTAPAPEAAAPDAAAPAAAAPAAAGKDPSYQELFQSAQVVYTAATGGGGEKVDYGVVAGAGSDLLHGLSAHTKLDEGAFGSYLTKAEGYLDSYHASHTAKDLPVPAPAAPEAPVAAAAEPPSAPVAPVAEPAPEAAAPPAPEAAAAAPPAAEPQADPAPPAPAVHDAPAPASD